MKLITRDTDYALRAICFVAKSEHKKIPVGRLVDKLKIPRSFLRKILQILSKKRIFKSYKGKGGGFMLIKPIDKIFLLDLIEIFQGPLRLNECSFKKRACPNTKRCVLRKKINSIEKYVVSQLKDITVAVLLK